MSINGVPEELVQAMEPLVRNLYVEGWAGHEMQDAVTTIIEKVNAEKQAEFFGKTFGPKS